jgi:predicted nucleic acid-binding protein
VISSKAVVIDANIILRAAFGKQVAGVLSKFENAGFYTPEHCLSEARKNVPVIAKRKKVDISSALQLLDQLIEEGLVLCIDHDSYGGLKERALRRTAKHDPTDWPVIAVALLLSAPIWTEDRDFFGTGIATWATDRIQIYLRDA